MIPWLLAATTADDIFKSMGSGGAAAGDGAGIQPGSVLLVVAAVVGLIVLISTLNRRDAKPKRPETNSQPAKLLKDVAREMGLRRKDLRELKKLAAISGVDSPVTLLLCPSVMRSAMAKRDASQSK